MVRGYFCVTKKRSITKHKLNLVGLKVKIHYPKQINTFLTAFKITLLYFLKNKENLHLESIRCLFDELTSMRDLAFSSLDKVMKKLSRWLSSNMKKGSKFGNV